MIRLLTIVGLLGLSIYLSAQSRLSGSLSEFSDISDRYLDSEPATRNHPGTYSGITFGPVFSHLTRGWGETDQSSEINYRWFLTYPNSRIGFGTSVFIEHLIKPRYTVRTEFNLLYQNQLAHYKRELESVGYQTTNYYQYNIKTFQFQLPLLFGVTLGDQNHPTISIHAGPGLNTMVFNRSTGESVQYVSNNSPDTTYIAAHSGFDHRISRFFTTFHYLIGAHFTIRERPVRLEFTGSSVLNNLVKQPSYSSRNWGFRILIPFQSFR